jgi:hypothetical protein
MVMQERRLTAEFSDRTLTLWVPIAATICQATPARIVRLSEASKLVTRER